MVPPINAQMLLQMLQQRPGTGVPPLPMIGGPQSVAEQEMQHTDATKPDVSTGAAVPPGIAPGGQGTAVGPIAGPRNPNVINNPDFLRETVTRMLNEPPPSVDFPSPPSPIPVPTMEPRPTGWGGRAILERIAGGMAGLGGAPNPFEVQRQMRENRAMQIYGAQRGAQEEEFKNQLAVAQAKAKSLLEGYQAKRQMLMGLGYALPAFGISRTGAGGATGAPKVSNVLKFNQGLPVSVTDPATGATYPIDPADKGLSQIPDHLKPLVLAAQRQHSSWFQEQQRLIQTRGESFRLNTMYPVLDAEDGMAPVMIRGYEILNNPGRYNAGSLGQMAMNRQNLLLDIGDLSKTVRSDFHSLDREFSGEQRAMMAAALGAPPGQAGQYLESLVRSGLSPSQSKLATDMIQLKENAMALRGILPGGTTETMRAAVANTLPGANTPSIPYADTQLDALDAQIARLSRGVPKVSMRAPGGTIPQAGEGAAPPSPVRGPVASQPPLAVRPRTAPPEIRQQAAPRTPSDIQQQIPEYVRGADGKLHLKGQVQ